MLVITQKLIYSFETTVYIFAPYMLFLVEKQIFISVILVNLFKNLINNHTRENNFVAVYSITASFGSSCIPAFVRKLRTTWE